MTNKTLNVDDQLRDYLLKVSLREDALAARLRAETADMPGAQMQIAPEQGQFMALLVRLINARRAIELGVFTGYSSLCMARALPADGQLIACDTDTAVTDVAQRYWKEAGIADRIQLRIAPALDTLTELLAQGEAGRFDLAFIDADKSNYGRYYELVLELLRPGGLALIDNTLWSGRVADPNDNNRNTQAIREFNFRIQGDERVDLSLLPIADGLTLARKRDNA